MARNPRRPPRPRKSQTNAYPPDTFMRIDELAKALGVSRRTIEKNDLPTIYFGKRTKRYCWGQVVEVLKARAM